MFDFLQEIESTKVVSAVYYAVRLIGHRDQLNDAYEGFKVENAGSEPSYEDEKLALLIVDAIEQTEGTRLPDMDDATAEEYVLQLYQIAQQRAADEFGYNADRGRELLGQFEPAISQQVGQNSN
jgi:hypothetical protein